MPNPFPTAIAVLWVDLLVFGVAILVVLLIDHFDV